MLKNGLQFKIKKFEPVKFPLAASAAGSVLSHLCRSLRRPRHSYNNPLIILDIDAKAQEGNVALQERYTKLFDGTANCCSVQVRCAAANRAIQVHMCAFNDAYI
mgnify:CR=1 FL=1